MSFGNFKSGFKDFTKSARESIAGKDEKPKTTTTTHGSGSTTTSTTTRDGGYATNQTSYELPKPPAQKTPPPPPPSATTTTTSPSMAPSAPAGTSVNQTTATPPPRPLFGKPPPLQSSSSSLPQQQTSQPVSLSKPVTLEKQPQAAPQLYPQVPDSAVEPPQRPPKPITVQPYTPQPQSHPQMYPQPLAPQQTHQSSVSLAKNTDGATEYHHNVPVPQPMAPDTNNHKDKSLSSSLSSSKNTINTHSRIALTTIGATSGDMIKADYPILMLKDPNYVATLQYTEAILDVEKATIKPLVKGEKQPPLFKETRFIIYKTIVDDTIILNIGHVYIYTNYREMTACRIYPYHYMIADNYNNCFIIKFDKDTPQECLDKMEVIMTYYTSYYRVPIKEDHNDKTAKKMDKATTKLEKGSLAVSKGLVTGGTYFAKGAAKVGDVYKNNTKAYDGPEMTEEQRRKLEDPDSDVNKSVKNTDKMVQGSSSVKNGIVGAFGLAGSKMSEGVRKTDWYKEREEKKKREEELNGKNEKKEAGAKMGGAGVSAVTNVIGGLEEGILISSRGVRDASVDATRHKHGDYAAEVSKKKWDAAGNCTISVVNILSIVGTTWIKGALYAAAGAITYDPDKAQNLTGAWWKAGWVMQKSSLLSGSRWSPRWMVLRNPTIALYSSPLDPSDKPVKSFYIDKVRGVKHVGEEHAQRSHTFELVTVGESLYFSTYAPEVDWSNEPILSPHPDTELHQWMDLIANLSKYVELE
ncbi:hypothetical protein SAMD00019534_059130 [Acytostelium subglobosum LB1]|uniref:hypothetical protein n=1 Tax=Acytostelium subglobosum LB1 TaxID=1410327 RepID=UPI000644C539|nr:hypothetical protein SAMD00019534_059130 [Acytostelium subglobosum LB1]GAM22738.1 hypothetical protein SAMD00019534_059130 [Acytostelium subglobosum LB1]|eukprot:XP_012753965.1 hypothetical protein SAMD00019534_059130 [Acytostelium subglobosum LB1]